MTVYSSILSKHFEKYGFDDRFFETYESVADDEMQNMDALCDMLRNIQVNQVNMVIYTDFDVDGIMSSVVAYAGLSELNFNVKLYKPTPSNGYGFHKEDVDGILTEFPGTMVILTGDVGITDNEAIAYARSKGITVLVTDHHIGKQECAANITVNPNQYGETYSHNDICGSYVMYKVIEKYAKRYCSPAKQADIYRLQVFAGIATVSDVMPLVYENRQLVRNSVSIMRYFFGYELSNNTIAPPIYSDNYSRAFVGLKKLLEYFKNIRKIKYSDDIDEQFYSFYLVPYLNSCKRMDGDMRGIYDIFFSDRVSPIEGFPNMSCVETGIKYIETLNERRKTVTAENFESLLSEKEAGESENSRFMQSEVYIADVGAGICGLLANKFMSLTGLPTLVIVEAEDGSFNGSGRNPGWFDFEGKLVEYGVPVICAGHREAFGVTIPDRAALVKYETFFRDVVLVEYRKLVDKAMIVDTAVTIANTSGYKQDFYADTELIREYLAEKESFHPYGQAFPEPEFKFVVNANSVTGCMFGRENQHYRFITDNGIDILLFNQALDIEKLQFDCKGHDFAWLFRGSFRYDSFDTEYDTICFYADSVEIAERI